MKNQKPLLSALRLKRLREQGYDAFTDREITDMAFGIRFAYSLCTIILIPAVIFKSVPVLAVMMSLAFLSVISPNHPFDYIYNLVIVPFTDRPKLPRRSIQLKFACSIATLWIGSITYFFYHGMDMTGFVLGALFISVAGILSTTDYCLPSVIFNAIFTKNQIVQNAH